MKLQTRIALSAAAAVLAAVALFAVGAYYLISQRAYDRLDRSLATTADRVAQELQAPDLGDRDFAAPPSPGSPAQPAPGPRAPTPPAPACRWTRRAGMVPGGPRTVTLDGQRYRLLVRSLGTGADGGRRSVAVARPLTDVEETLDEVALELGLAALLAALIATSLALLIVRRALRPLVQAQPGRRDRGREPGPVGARPRGARRRDRRPGPQHEPHARPPGGRPGAPARDPEPSSGASPPTPPTRCAPRSPPCAANIEMLARHDLPPDEREAMLDDMATSVERMDRLVEGLLGLARIDGGARAGGDAWTWARWSARSPPARSATAWSPASR